MALTQRFGFYRFGGPLEGSLNDRGGQFSNSDRAALDRILSALESHEHIGGERLEGPSAAPALTLFDTGGSLPAGTTLYYRVSYVDQFGLETAATEEVSVTTRDAVPPPDAPQVEAQAGGDLQTGLHWWALTAITPDGGETPLGSPALHTVESSAKTVQLTFAIPDGASAVAIWRQGPLDSGFTRLEQVATTTYVDDGSIPSDPCPTDPLKLPPLENETNATSSVEVEIPAGDVAEGTSVVLWRVYRTDRSGFYSDASLVAELLSWVNTTVDTGAAEPDWGAPLEVGRTLEPSVEIEPGGNVHVDDSRFEEAEGGHLLALPSELALPSFAETFDRADDSEGWGDPWVETDTSENGSAYLQTNVGYLEVTPNASDPALVVMDGPELGTSAEIEALVELVDVHPDYQDGVFGLHAHVVDPAELPDHAFHWYDGVVSGYSVLLETSSGDVYVYLRAGGTYSQRYLLIEGVAANDRFRLKIVTDGNDVRATAWRDGDPEPAPLEWLRAAGDPQIGDLVAEWRGGQTAVHLGARASEVITTVGVHSVSADSTFDPGLYVHHEGVWRSVPEPKPKETTVATGVMPPEDGTLWLSGLVPIDGSPLLAFDRFDSGAAGDPPGATWTVATGGDPADTAEQHSQDGLLLSGEAMVTSDLWSGPSGRFEHLAAYVQLSFVDEGMPEDFRLIVGHDPAISGYQAWPTEAYYIRVFDDVGTPRLHVGRITDIGSVTIVLNEELPDLTGEDMELHLDVVGPRVRTHVEYLSTVAGETDTLLMATQSPSGDDPGAPLTYDEGGLSLVTAAGAAHVTEVLVAANPNTASDVEPRMAVAVPARAASQRWQFLEQG